MNPTIMALADIFLPASTFAEHNGLVQPYYGGNMQYMGAINKAVTVGEAKSDVEIMIALGKRLNPEAHPWDTAEEFFEDHVHSQLGQHFADIQNDVCVQLPYHYHKYQEGKMRRRRLSRLEQPHRHGGVPFRRIWRISAKTRCRTSRNARTPRWPMRRCTTSAIRSRSPRACANTRRSTASTGMIAVAARDRPAGRGWSINPADRPEEYGVVDGELGHHREHVRRLQHAGPRARRTSSRAWWWPRTGGGSPNRTPTNRNLYGNWKANVNKLHPVPPVLALGLWLHP